MTSEIYQIGEDWQDGVSYDHLKGDEEHAAREYINTLLRRWGITIQDNDINHYIMRAWDYWVASQLG